MFSCCTRTRSKCSLLFLPEAKLLLYFLELLIVNFRVFKKAKYIPLVNEEINLFKSWLVAPVAVIQGFGDNSGNKS